jgi:hypothetical protein
MPVPRFDFQKILVQVERSLINRSDWIKYLVVPHLHLKPLENVLTRAPDAAFTKFVDKQLQSYLGGTAPPEPIQTAIMNLADDVASGREVTLRAGDYIALQSHYMKSRKTK